MALVVDGYVVAFYRCPECLEVAVEEEGIEATWWGYLFAKVKQIERSQRGVFGLEVNWRGMGVERNGRVA